VKTRTIISLERAQLRALQVQARAKGVSVAELIRGLVADGLRSDRHRPRVTAATYARIIGLGSSGRDDVADRHDTMLADALRREHDR